MHALPPLTVFKLAYKPLSSQKTPFPYFIRPCNLLHLNNEMVTRQHIIQNTPLDYELHTKTFHLHFHWLRNMDSSGNVFPFTKQRIVLKVIKLLIIFGDKNHRSPSRPTVIYDLRVTIAICHFILK